jgi:hypothetical protein
MRLAGIFLLLAGWAVVVSALVLLPSPGMRSLFVLAGVGVEGLALVLAFRKEAL